MPHRVSALILALIVVGSPLATMVCQLTCVEAATVDPHACCHHSADASRQSIACASSACDHADETVTAVAVVDPVIVAPAIINTTTVVAADGLERPATGTASNYSLPRFQSRTSPLRI